ncbi:MAG: AbrB/MazE/SpoVT family DNA-binding domain-containing protein [Chloroflexi bacterium]|nr:AbrB/MazE/SpoVT family DNA-binding domain-containing protein [Chloroflexota bacterium]
MWKQAGGLSRWGSSLVVTMPSEVIEEWNLGKGDQVTLEIVDGAVRIEPKQPTKITTISETSLEEYTKVMEGIQARVTMDWKAGMLQIELSGADREAVNTVLNNLWRNLPVLLRMLGLGAVTEQTATAKETKRRRSKHGKRTDADSMV